MGNKDSHLGMAGEHAAMAAFLRRGYNVASPTVDVGEDIFVIKDGTPDTWRVQVKCSENPEQLSFSIKNLDKPGPVPLYVMLLTCVDERWWFLIRTQADLFKMRLKYEAKSRSGQGGRPRYKRRT